KTRTLYPRPVLSTGYLAPRNETEGRIAEIWSDLLGIVEVGVDDNFFDLGGNSLLGVDLMTRLNRELGGERLPAYVLYQASTISALARYLHAPLEVDSLEDQQYRGEMRRERLQKFKSQGRRQAE